MENIESIKQNKDNKQIESVTTNTNVFNEKKNELKKFSENLPKEINLPSVPSSGGLFGWFNYDVTGKDLNSLTESIQDKMIEQNQAIVRTIQEFNTIYDTFSALDKEYIQGILISLKAAEEANAKALKGLEGVQVNQNEMKQIINQQKQVIQTLKNFKDKIEKIEHLTDIDKGFVAFSEMKNNVKEIERKIKTQELMVVKLSNEMKSTSSLQLILQDNLNNLKEIQVKEFQTVEQQISNQNESISKIEVINIENKTNIEILNKEVNNHNEEFNVVKQLIQTDIQTLSEKVDGKNSEFDAKLNSIDKEVTKNKLNFENIIKELNVEIEQHVDSMSAHFESELLRASDKIEELNSLIRNLSKDVKNTKVALFVSIAIICVLVILIISGVL